ncbi:hypothetical protein tb265_06010 [Gemmatimonadetes bacterium T265]|nr:hypothetical protein tb265_06010 [Gemmatimonadetes bacterium T265]
MNATPAGGALDVGALGMAAGAPAVVGRLLGDPGARARVVAYGTFECLHCRRAWPALRALADDPSAGVAVEWRHFAPAGAFPNAAGAARAAEAAALQDGPCGRASDGAYWAMHDALMAAPSPLWPERVDGVAAALGLDLARLHRDAASDAVRARVDAQRAAALADGVRGTPAAFLDGARVDLDDLESFRDQITRGG